MLNLIDRNKLLLMSFKLIEDFLSLAKSKNFSRAAAERNVTQPAFSRRIQQLETWVGVPLVDRSTYPTKLTQAGLMFRDVGEQSLKLIFDSRTELRDMNRLSKNTINFSTPYSLSTYFFPKWLSELQKELGEISTRLILSFTHNRIETLVDGSCDFLICHYHPDLPLTIDENKYPYKILGTEKLVPVSAPGDNNKPLYTLLGSCAYPIPHLSYSSESYLGKTEGNFLSNLKTKLQLNRIYESPMSESIKKMAIEGHGLAWLPDSSIRNSITHKTLVRGGNKSWDIHLEVRIYRFLAKTDNSLEKTNCPIEKLWEILPQKNLNPIN